jgi:hypothetical protein
LSNVGIPFPAPYKKIEKIKDKDSIDIWDAVMRFKFLINNLGKKYQLEFHIYFLWLQ